MLAFRYFSLFNFIALCSFATTVNPLVGYIQWSSDNHSGQGWFEVGIHTNTNDGSAELPDYIKLVNVSLVIDVQVGQSILTQAVSLHRAFTQAEVVNQPATNVLLPSYTCDQSDCPGGIGSYFSQSFGPRVENSFHSPAIVAARLTYTAIAQTAAMNDPYWRYTNTMTGSTTLFRPDLIARTVTLVPGSSTFVYNGSDAPVAFLDVNGEQVPEPSTMVLCGAALAIPLGTRIRSRFAARR